MFVLFLKQWWKEIFIVVAIAGGIWYVKNLQDTVQDQKATIQIEKAKNEILVANEAKLSAALSATSDAFDSISKVDKQNKEQFAKLTTIVNNGNTNITQRLAKILTEKKPVTCEETIQYLIDGAKGYNK